MRKRKPSIKNSVYVPELITSDQPLPLGLHLLWSELVVSTLDQPHLC